MWRAHAKEPGCVDIMSLEAVPSPPPTPSTSVLYTRLDSCVGGRVMEGVLNAQPYGLENSVCLN